jgi:serine/threonine-protein kinase haspin
VLVESTESPEIKYVMKGVKFTVPSQGIKARIIDFTLARLMGEDGHPIYLDLGKDEEQFLGTGDHQFNIYRMMRDYNR